MPQGHVEAGPTLVGMMLLGMMSAAQGFLPEARAGGAGWRGASPAATRAGHCAPAGYHRQHERQHPCRVWECKPAQHAQSSHCQQCVLGLMLRLSIPERRGQTRENIRSSTSIDGITIGKRLQLQVGAAPCSQPSHLPSQQL